MTVFARPRSAIDDFACLALVAIALTSCVRWWATMSMVAGGADSYGYVSESRLVLGGSLIQRPIQATWLPLDRADALGVSAPLGYIPSLSNDGVAPIYPPGLPVLMAIATIIGGPSGPFFVAPIMGLAGLVLVYAIARVWFDRLTACAAVAFVAWNPLYVAYARQPMSDVPATAVFLLALWLVARAPSRPMSAGAAAGVAFLIRPALAGGCAVVALAAWWHGGLRGLLRCSAVLAVAVLAQMGVQWFLYGHPLQSGYGSPSTLFTWSIVPTNLAVYGGWLARAHGIMWCVALALGLVFAGPREPRVGAIVLLVAVAAPYLLYFEFDHWETLRFVLPGLVALTIVAASGVTRTLSRLQVRWVVPIGVVACAALLAVESNRWLERQGTWRLAALEEKYPLVARWISDSTSPTAIVMAFQHSGSIRHYAGRFTLRWDVLRAENLVPVLRALSARHVDVVAVFEGPELEQFRERFRDVLHEIELLPAGQARGVIVMELRLK